MAVRTITGMLAVAVAPALASCQATVSEPRFTIVAEPAVPVRGAIARLRLVPLATAPLDSIVAVEAELGGEPLHFDPTSNGAFASLAGIPIDGGDSLPVDLTLVTAGNEPRHVTIMLGVAKGSYGIERLTVEPKLAEPDSATRVRIAMENALALLPRD